MGQDKLTEKQEAFAMEFISNGRNATEAYEKTYDSKTKSKGSLWVQAHKVLHNSKVSIRIHELEMAQFSKQILTLDERKMILSQQGKEGNYKSIDLLNKMDGVYIEKKEVTINGEIELTKLPTKDEAN